MTHLLSTPGVSVRVMTYFRERDMLYLRGGHDSSAINSRRVSESHDLLEGERHVVFERGT